MMNPCIILLKKHTNLKGEREEQNKKNQSPKNEQHPKMKVQK